MDFSLKTLKNTYTGRSGVTYEFEYQDADSFEHLEPELCRQTYAVCLCEGNMVIVHNGKAGTWGLVGGTIEKGETLEQTLRREIQEESNMDIIDFLPVGYQKMVDTRDGTHVYQLRYVCTAKPFGDFEVDPAGSVDKICCIPPAQFENYFDWGPIGRRIVERAMELSKNLKTIK